MATIFAMASFSRSRGKSTIIANLAALLAARGRRVGLFDLDVYSPALHVLLRLREEEIRAALDDYLLGAAPLSACFHDVTSRLPVPVAGALFLVPASKSLGGKTDLRHADYQVDRLAQSIYKMGKNLALDVLLIDTSSGVNEETLLAMALCDTLAIVLGLQEKDYQGTSVMIELAERLGVGQVVLIVNPALTAYHADEVRTRIEQTYACPVVAVLPHSEDVVRLASADSFVMHYPDHPLTILLQQIADSLGL